MISLCAVHSILVKMKRFLLSPWQEKKSWKKEEDSQEPSSWRFFQSFLRNCSGPLYQNLNDVSQNESVRDSEKHGYGLIIVKLLKIFHFSA